MISLYHCGASFFNPIFIISMDSVLMNPSKSVTLPSLGSAVISITNSSRRHSGAFHSDDQFPRIPCLIGQTYQLRAEFINFFIRHFNIMQMLFYKHNSSRISGYLFRYFVR